MPTPRFALLVLVIGYVIMGVNGVYSKIIPLPAASITELRSIIAAGALCVFMLFTRQSFALANTKQVALVGLLGVLMAVHWCAFFGAMQTSTVAIGVLAHYSYPVFTVVVEPLLDKRMPARRDLMAGCAVLCGVTLMVPSWELGSDAFMGVLLGLASAVTFGTRNILQHRHLKTASSGTVMFYQLVVVSIVVAPFTHWPLVASQPLPVWQLLLLLGVISTALTHTLVIYSLRALSAKTVSLISCMQPPTAIILTWWLIGEVPTANTLAGGTLIIGTALYEAIKTGRMVNSK